MIDERGDVVPPSSFLPTAEKFGLIGDIDRWMLRQGVDLAASGRPVHINLSGQSLGRTELFDDFERWMTASGANPADIVIELTETLAVANMAQAGAFAKRLQALGCGLALDDFGTGFGSFTYLKHLPADFLKIDMEFVRDIAHDETNVRVVDAIVDVARRFGLRTIAEGVEDERTLDLLREAGVDCAQGYHLGRPVDAHESRPGAVGESVRV
jgi:EAL domain-containing protein (putative c-di-GMP-specific phosphodiesterase class I)